jgi:hypothetical protein
LRSKNGGRRDEDTLLDELSGPSQTVCTSAWAGTNQSRASSEIDVPASSGSKEGIKVKQIITQQSQLEI